MEANKSRPQSQARREQRLDVADVADVAAESSIDYQSCLLELWGTQRYCHPSDKLARMN